MWLYWMMKQSKRAGDVQISGRKITVTLAGEQTEYTQINEKITIKAAVKINRLLLSREDKVQLYYTNENAVRYETEEAFGYDEKPIQIVAPNELLLMNSMENNNGRTESLDYDKSIVLETKKPEQSSQISLKLMNHTNNILSQIKVVGEIETTFENSMIGEIAIPALSPEEYDVYYSEKPNKEINTDLLKPENGWKKVSDGANISKTKSYLIVIKDEITLGVGEELEAKYMIQIPQDLNYNEYFRNQYKTAVFTGLEYQQEQSKQLELTTGKGPILETSIKAQVNNTNVTEVSQKQILRYVIELNNHGEEGTDVIINASIPEGTTYTYYSAEQDEYINVPDKKEVQFNPTAVEPGENGKKVFAYEVFVNEGITEEQLEGSISLANSKDAAVTSFDLPIVKVSDAPIQIIAESLHYPETSILPYQEPYNELVYSTKVKNITEEKLYMLEVEVYFPENTEMRMENGKLSISDYYLYDEETQIAIIPREERYYLIGSQPKKRLVKIEDNYYEYDEETLEVFMTVIPEGQVETVIEDLIEYNEEHHSIKIIIPSLNPDQQIQVITNATVKNIESDGRTETITGYSTVTIGEETYQSNEMTNTVKYRNSSMTIEKAADAEHNIIEETKFNYIITVENKGVSEEELEIVDILPEGVTPIKYSYTAQGDSASVTLGESKTITIKPTIQPGEKIDIYLEVIVDKLPEGMEERTITNTASIIMEDLADKVSNEVTNTIEKKAEDPKDPDDPEYPDDPNDPVPAKKYKIGGVAFVDENKNGIRETAEEIVKNMKIILLSETGTKLQETLTDNTGKYEFKDLAKGKYIITFEYDNIYYMLAKEQKAEVKIEITATSKTDADIMLYRIPTFDLKIEKTVSKITIQTKKGNKSFTFDKALAKVEIGRREIDGANVVIEYNIRVINQGEIEGYAAKIEDLIPKNASFKSELNKDWYLENGVAISTALRDQVLKPGETSKDLKLTLTKTMTESTDAIVSNTAAIKESSNKEGILDMSRLSNDEKIKGNEKSTADAIIGPSTGEIILYIALTIVILSIIGAGAYFINKKV